jgi:2-methylcitrate dehydratase PrpD
MHHGLTGRPDVFEGTALGGGFCKITSQVEPKYERITDRLGEHYSIMDVYFKPYTACRHTHGAAQAVLDMLQSEKIDPADVEAVQVYTYGIAQMAVGKGLDGGATFVSAQFSIPYVVAVCLYDGCLGPEQLTEKRLADPQVVSLSRKVSVVTDLDINAAYPEKTSTRVEVGVRSGRRLVRQVDIPRGDPRDPMDESRLIEKLKQFAGGRESGRLDALVDSILNLEKIKDIRKITEAV